jgi:hypothetical protein
MLERQFDYKVTVRDTRGGPLEQDLAKVMGKLIVEPSKVIPDLRLGVVLFDANGGRLGAIYVDGSGKKGLLDDIPMLLNGDLHSWVTDTFRLFSL